LAEDSLTRKGIEVAGRITHEQCAVGRHGPRGPVEGAGGEWERLDLRPAKVLDGSDRPEKRRTAIATHLRATSVEHHHRVDGRCRSLDQADTAPGPEVQLAHPLRQPNIR